MILLKILIVFSSFSNIFKQLPSVPLDHKQIQPWGKYLYHNDIQLLGNLAGNI